MVSRAASDEPSPFRQLTAMAKVGVIGFGGGSALIPVMERELVSSRIGLSEKTFVQDTVIANITPGALPVKIAALAGVQRGGAFLSLGSAVAVALPGAAATVALLALFDRLGASAVRAVEYASLGITAFIVYLLAHYVHKVLHGAGHRTVAYVVIAVLSFLATGGPAVGGLVTDLAGVEIPPLPALSALGLVVTAISAIAVFTMWTRMRARIAQEGREDEADAPPRTRGALTAMLVLVLAGFALAVLVDPAGVLPLLGLVGASTVSSFGGGEAYVGVADGFFVASGLIGDSAFYGQAVPVANALPGPILVKIAAAVGYFFGAELGGLAAGLTVAVAAFAISIGACCALALAVLSAYDRARHSLFVGNIAAFILPVICGLLATTSVSMLHSNVRIAADAGSPPAATVAATILLTLVIVGLRRVTRVPDVVLILACAALSLGILTAL